MQEVNEFGIGMITGDKPKVGIFEGKSKKFVMEDEFSVDAFEKFVNVLVGFNAKERKAFLQFTTGCSSLPPGKFHFN